MTETPGLTGPVRTVTSRTVTLESNGDETPSHSTTEQFDDRGRLIRQTSFHGDGGLWYGTTLRYDADGRLCERTYQNADGSTHVVSVASTASESSEPGNRVFYSHDEAGRIIGIARYGFDDPPGSIEYAPTLAGRIARRLGPVPLWLMKMYMFWLTARALIRRRQFQRLWRSMIYGTLFSEEFRAYDDQDQVIEERTAFLGGALETRTTRAYDERGLVAESASYNERGVLEHRARYERTFDAHGNWIEERCVRWPRGCSGGVCDSESEGTSVTSRHITYYNDGSS